MNFPQRCGKGLTHRGISQIHQHAEHCSALIIILLLVQTDIRDGVVCGWVFPLCVPRNSKLWLRRECEADFGIRIIILSALCISSRMGLWVYKDTDIKSSNVINQRLSKVQLGCLNAGVIVNHKTRKLGERCHLNCIFLHLHKGFLSTVAQCAEKM